MFHDYCNTRCLLECLNQDICLRDTRTCSKEGTFIIKFAEDIKYLWSEHSLQKVVIAVPLESHMQSSLILQQSYCKSKT